MSRYQYTCILTEYFAWLRLTPCFVSVSKITPRPCLRCSRSASYTSHPHPCPLRVTARASSVGAGCSKCEYANTYLWGAWAVYGGCMGAHGGAWGRMGCTVNTWIYADGAAVRTLVYRRAMVSTYHYLPLQLYLRLKHPPHLTLSLSPYFNLDGNAMVFNISSMRRRSAMSLPMEK